MAASRAAFVNMLWPAALQASQATGIDPRIIVAQAAQETGWGNSAPGNNYFGIKSHGKSGGQTFTTHEVVNGQRVKINDSFRQFGSPAESVAGYASFMLENPRYQPLRQAKGLDAQLAALGQSGYATDPNYAASVGAIARSLPAGSTLKSSDMPPSSLSGIGSPNVPSPGSDSLMGGAGSDNLGSGLGMTPEEAADMAALLQKKKQRGNPFDNIDWGFAEAPRISGGGGDARSTGNMLLEALNAPTAADMLLKKRLQGIR